MMKAEKAELRSQLVDSSGSKLMTTEEGSLEETEANGNSLFSPFPPVQIRVSE
jgi:hypothetical protein